MINSIRKDPQNRRLVFNSFTPEFSDHPGIQISNIYWNPPTKTQNSNLIPLFFPPPATWQLYNYNNYHLIFSKFWGSQLHRWKVLSSIRPQHVKAGGSLVSTGRKISPRQTQGPGQALRKSTPRCSGNMVYVFLPRKKKKTLMFFWFDNPKKTGWTFRSTQCSRGCFVGEKHNKRIVKMFFWGLGIWEMHQLMINPTGFFNKSEGSNFVKSIWSHHVPWWPQDFLDFSRTWWRKHVKHASKSMPMKITWPFKIWFPETGLTGSPKKFNCHCFEKPKKWVKNQWPQIYWIYLDMIYTSYFAIISLEQKQLLATSILMQLSARREKLLFCRHWSWDWTG